MDAHMSAPPQVRYFYVPLGLMLSVTRMQGTLQRQQSGHFPAVPYKVLRAMSLCLRDVMSLPLPALCLVCRPPGTMCERVPTWDAPFRLTHHESQLTAAHTFCCKSRDGNSMLLWVYS